MLKKVVLINPNSPFLINPKVFPPLGLLYVASVFEQNAVDVEVVDLSGVLEGEWDTALSMVSEVSLAGISVTTPQFPESVKILEKIKEINPNCNVVIGGPHVSCDPESCYLFNVKVLGEGEPAVKELISENPRRVIQPPFITKLDTIPFPARHLIHIKSYKYYIDDVLATTVMTSRGCPFTCAFCCNVWGKKTRFRSAKNVIGELEELRTIYGYHGVMFFDDVFVLRRKRLKVICDYLKKEDWISRCFIRSDLVNDEVYKLLADAGCVEVGIGVESGSQRILDNVKKGTTVEQNYNAIKLAQKHGIRAKTFMIVGLPGENVESLLETEEFLEDAQPDDLDITILNVYKGTEIYEHPERFDLNFNYNYGFFKGIPGCYDTSISTSCLSSEEILEWRNYLEKRFKKW